MDDNVEDCPVCLTAYDDTLRRPRTMPCGHTFCTPCLDGLQKHGHVTCPTCRVEHVVPEAGRFPISYTIEGFIRRLRGAALASTPPMSGKNTPESGSSPVPGSGDKGIAGLSRSVRSLLQEQETKILAAICICQEVQTQLHQYQTTLVGWGKRQQHLENRLMTLVDQSKSARVLVQQEESHVAAKREEVQQGELQLHTLLQILRTVATRHEAYEAINDAEHRTEEERQRAEESLVLFPDVHTVSTINKVRKASNAALEAATTVQAAEEKAVSIPLRAAGDSVLPTAPAYSITDRLEALLAPTLQVEDLRSLTQPTRNLLHDGLVFAVHHVDGRSRHARISLKDGRLYLHSLQDQPLPPRSVTVQMDEVVPAAPPCLVFLDLVWPGSCTPRRVLVRLSPDTPLGRQFLLLCTGQRGPCYAKTRLFEVVNKGQQGECLCGGDYDNNDGTGGAALLPDLSEGRYRRPGRAGDVWGWRIYDPAKGAQFSLITRGWQGSILPGVFGKVLEGLESVTAAAQYDPITEVTVVDCGVVLLV